MDGWMHELINQWMNGLINEWINERMDELRFLVVSVISCLIMSIYGTLRPERRSFTYCSLRSIFNNHSPQLFSGMLVMQTAHCFSKPNEVELQPSFGTSITLMS